MEINNYSYAWIFSARNVNKDQIDISKDRSIRMIFNSVCTKKELYVIFLFPFSSHISVANIWVALRTKINPIPSVNHSVSVLHLKIYDRRSKTQPRHKILHKTNVRLSTRRSFICLYRFSTKCHEIVKNRIQQHFLLLSNMMCNQSYVEFLLSLTIKEAIKSFTINCRERKFQLQLETNN